MPNFSRVAVLFGGPSGEREVSLESGRNVLQALQAQGIDAVGIDAMPGTLPEQLKASGAEIVFNMLHGRFGEDGVVQGCLEALDLPYTGSGVLASSLAMDKLRTKWLWKGAGLPTPEFRMLDADYSDWNTLVAEIGLPMMIKPIREGSSLGISKVKSLEELPAAIDEARRFDQVVIAERFIQGREVTAGILEGQALPVIRLETSREFYDYTAKYLVDDTRYLIPSGLGEVLESQVQELAIKAFAVVGCQTWGRVDFMVDGDGQPWLIEINTVPGMTSHSLVPMAAKAAGIEFGELVRCILDAARPRDGVREA
ncbi:D-alanine--D-alanine ligase [Thermithiobacillus plumbiphilus]|uniref:D-alanine--D-alanine ligase n=1 Tax=Thermithiobacillus plumbiphilus TaxID=1729899 RepID=A0ABU9D7S4_9PROT